MPNTFILNFQNLNRVISLSILPLRNEYATFKEIRTRTITVQGQKGDSKKAKLFITLQRSPNFFENMRKFNEIREENERLAAKNAQAAEGQADAKETKE